MQRRDDIVPVLLGGDIAIYALGRDFHEAYGLRSVCLASAPVAAIARSAIFDVYPLDGPANDENVLAAVRELADRDAEKTVFLMANTDAHIHLLGRIRDRLPENVVVPMPTLDIVQRVSDKAEFAEMCVRWGIRTPETVVIDLAGDGPIPPVDLPFPVVAKAAVAAEYQHLMTYEGFLKVHYIDSQVDLDALWASLRAAGFHGRFVVQKLVHGDDTNIGMFTVYMDGEGHARLFGSAQVLLEDHAPTMLGNPVAMLVTPQENSLPAIEAMLADLGYHGFANFDTKIDPETGELLFFELNPRIGRNSFYLMAAGVNPVVTAVEDLVDGRPGALVRTEGEALYTLVPRRLLMRYIADARLRERVTACYRAGKVANPQHYRADRGLVRSLEVWLTEMNQYRKFHRYYPQLTDSGF